MKQEYKQPVYTIGIVAELLKVCPATLRIWESKKLIKPARIGKNRFYSKCDLDRLEYIKELLEKGINIEGVKSILGANRCWEIKKCKPAERQGCSVYLKYGHN
ncbi:MerR family transcriptional regulator [Candidatus Omnitrophota bacterium]